jgi:PAS domain S-box-containing protein
VHQVELELQNEELRNAQAQIEESRARYSDLYDFAPIGYVTLDENGVIRQANLTAAKQLGIERSRLIHKPFQVHVSQADRERFHLHLQSVFKSNERQTCEVKLASHARVGLYIQMDGISVRDSSGSTLSNLAMTDITERKRMGEELLKARKLEATGVLAGGIAHDFNNLLAVILRHVNMAELELVNLIGGERESGKRGLSELSSTKKAVFLAADLTRKFLTFASGGEPRRVSIQVQQLVRDSSALALTGSPIVCEHSFGHDLDEVDGDPNQLRQALYDMMLNAREAMPGDAGSIRILAENSKSDFIDAESGAPMGIEEKYVRISIRDEGVGISEENLPRIFDPYFSTKNRGSQLFCRARDGGAPFDVVILDLTIPGGMGGKETIQKLREIDPHVKAIVSSGYSSHSVVADFRRFDFDGALPKPYQMTDLAEILREMMAE